MLFLSDEWIDATRDALGADREFCRLAEGVRLRLVIIPLEVPAWAGPVTVSLRDGVVEATRGISEAADAAGRATYADWLAMLRHELHPRTALLRRRLRGNGAPAILSNLKLIDRALDVFRENMPEE